MLLEGAPRSRRAASTPIHGGAQEPCVYLTSYRESAQTMRTAPATTLSDVQTTRAHRFGMSRAGWRVTFVAVAAVPRAAKPPCCATPSMHLTDIARIAVLRANGIGDLMFALPALDALRAAYPDAHITLLGARHHAALLAGRPSPVDRVIVIPPSRGVNEVDGPEEPSALDHFFAAMRAERFDLAVQMHGGGQFSNPFTRRLGARLSVGLKADNAPPLDRWIPYTYWQPEVARYLELVTLVGAMPRAIAPRLAVTTRDLEEAEELVPSTGAPLVLLNPGGTDPRRRWPEDRFAAVGNALAEQGACIVVNGSGAEREIAACVAGLMRADAIDVAGRLSLSGLVGLASRCSVVISNDSGPLYVSAAAGAPTVGIYWCGNLATSGMLTRARHRPVASWQLECSVCGAHCVYDECTHRPSFVSHVTVRDVIAAARDVWTAPEAARCSRVGFSRRAYVGGMSHAPPVGSGEPPLS